MAKKQTSKSVALTAVTAPVLAITYPASGGNVPLSNACTFTAEGSVDANALRILYVSAVVNGSTYYGTVLSDHLWTISNIGGRLGDCNSVTISAFVVLPDGLTTVTISSPTVSFMGTGGSSFCMSCSEINDMVAKRTAKRSKAKKTSQVAKQKPAKAAKV